MSQEPTRRKSVKAATITLGEKITDREELKRRAALLGPDDGGAGRMVTVVLEVAGDREASGRPVDLVGGVLGLIAHLTPEQQREVVRRLPEVLAAEALRPA